MTNRSEDEIVEELRRRRQAHAESLDYDLKRITADLQRQEAESGTRVVHRAAREPQVLPKRPTA